MKFLAASLKIFDLSLGEMLWSRRTIFMALVVGGPVIMALVFRVLELAGFPALRVNGARVGGPAIFGIVIWFVYLRFIVPVLGAFYGTSLIADEVDDKTITYLFTRPIPRGAIAIGKYLSYLVCTGLVVLPSVVLVYFLVVPIGGGGDRVRVPRACPRRCAAWPGTGSLRGFFCLHWRTLEAPTALRARLRVRVGDRRAPVSRLPAPPDDCVLPPVARAARRARG